jgi:hypothetical protein
VNTQPATVFALGDLRFYGRENAEKAGQTKFCSRTHGSKVARNDLFAIYLKETEQLKEIYLNAEHKDSYYRDQSVFEYGISIEDTMGVIVKYRSGALLTYSLVAYTPYERFRVCFNGSEGRLEATITKKSYVNSGGEQSLEGAIEEINLVVHPMFAPPYKIDVEGLVGGHGGGDPVLLNNLVGIPTPDALNCAASHIDGAMSILTGIAANKALRTEQVVQVKDLVRL